MFLCSHHLFHGTTATSQVAPTPIRCTLLCAAQLSQGFWTKILAGRMLLTDLYDCLCKTHMYIYIYILSEHTRYLITNFIMNEMWFSLYPCEVCSCPICPCNHTGTHYECPSFLVTLGGALFCGQINLFGPRYMVFWTCTRPVPLFVWPTMIDFDWPNVATCWSNKHLHSWT